MNEMYISLGVYFLLMLGIGVFYYFRSRHDITGFLLGGRAMSPSVTALSAGASDMSGWMLMGYPGALYLTGVDATWIGIGLVIGAYLNYLWVAPRLRVYTVVANDALTIPQFFEHRFEDHAHVLRILCAFVIIVFFAIYTTSGVVAGGKFFESTFAIDYQTGAFITVAVVVAYSAFGGFGAVSTTDFVQGCIMLVALIAVPLMAAQALGGIGTSFDVLRGFDASLLRFSDLSLLAVFSALAWGLGYFGQPHIIVRFMAIRSVEELPTARRIGMTWMVLSLIGATLVGLIGLAYVKKMGVALGDAETIFIYLSIILFPPYVAGFLLAAILAAIMSTISSQLLVVSSSLTEDIYHTLFRRQASAKELVLCSRLAVLLVAICAFALAQARDSSVLSLVSHAWAGFGAAFGPVVLLGLFWRRMNRQGALAGILVGALTVLVWVYAPIQYQGQALTNWMYEMIPGFISASIAIILVSLVTPRPTQSMLKHFDEVDNIIDWSRVPRL